MGNRFDIEDIYGKVYRHKRLFNYVVSPVSLNNGLVKCITGNNIQQDIPLDYFKRDWVYDESINFEDLINKMREYPEETPFTVAYTEYFEKDDGKEHSYIHFDDDAEEGKYRFPSWKITTCKKSDRDNIINPFTMIMPIRDEVLEEAKAEVELMNEIRLENEFIEFEDFQGFEFGLLKILEKKFLREI